MTAGTIGMVLASVAIGVLAGLAILEVGDGVLYRLRTGRWIWTRGPAPAPPHAVQALPVTYQAGPYRLQLHPYFGYAGKPGPVMRESAERGVMAEHMGEHFIEAHYPVLRLNNAGFWCADDYPVVYDPATTFVIGVFGGSVALQFGLSMDDILQEALKDVPQAANKKLVMLNFANGGGKQPQQLTTLAFYLTIGQRFDFILNMDGFNELFIGWLNIHENGTRIEMPFGRFITGVQSFVIDSDLAQRATPLKEALARLEPRRDRVRSALALRLLESQIATQRSRLQAVEQRMTQQSPERLRDLPMPVPPADDSVDYTSTVIEQWFNGSTGMHNLARGFGIPYLHILQPNHYFRHERFSDAEREQYLNLTHPPLLEILPPVYRGFVGRAAAFRALGIEFIDATELFEGRNFFYDNVCHINLEGNRMMARVIGQRMVAMLGATH